MAMKVVVEGTNITASQVSEFFRVAALPGSHINRASLQAFIEGRIPFEEKPIVEMVKKAVAVLAFVGMATAPAVLKPMDPSEAFQDRPGLMVSDSFRTRVLPILQPITSAPEANLTVSRIVVRANDLAICKELPEQHLAEWHHVISLIGKQPNGQVGTLLTNGDANIFYIRGVSNQVFAVSVRWYSDRREWFVNDWGLDEGDDWDADSQILYPVNAALG